MILLNFISTKMQTFQLFRWSSVPAFSIDPYLALDFVYNKKRNFFIQVNSINNVPSPSVSKHDSFPARHVNNNNNN